MSTHIITEVKPPVVGELEAIFRTLPDETLLSQLRGPRRRGRPGYNPTILWRSYVAYYALGIESISALIRTLHNNPHIAKACGIGDPDAIPSQPTFSRFVTKLAKQALRLAVKNVMRSLTRKLYETLPDFGKSIAIDSTDVKAWSNGGKKGHRAKTAVKRQKPLVGKVSDPDAGWVVKTNTEGNKKFVWGYKVHILADTQYELPIVVDTSRGNLHDVKKATPLLSQARFTTGKFYPRFVICDSAYSSDKLRRVVRRQYAAQCIIDPHPGHRKAVALRDGTPDWKTLYKRRTSIERVNSRLKAFYRLNLVRVRGRFKVLVHALLSVIVLQARAVAFPEQPRRCMGV